MVLPVVWRLIADPDRYKRGFREAEQTNTRFQRSLRQTERSNLRFSASMGSMGGAAMRAVGGATVALGGLAAAGAVLGVKTAANLETAQIGFTQLLGSAKRARSFLGDLKDFAARTPFELPGLVDAARSLIGAGTAAKDVIPILTSLGDASGALGLDQERFGRVMLAVTQIMNRGKVQAEELNQITEAGIPVWSLLAKATGKPVPELQKLMQSGKLLSKDVLPALFDQMHQDYGGGMAKQAKSLNGLWSTFKDTVSLTLANALQPLIPVLKTALPAAGEAFQRGIEGITRFIRSDFAPELGRVRLAWEQNESSILGFLTSLNSADGQMLTTKEAAAGLADSLERLIQFGGDVARFGDQVGGALNWISKQASDEGGAADKLGDALAQVLGLHRELGPTADDLRLMATNTGSAATAADRHAAAVRGEKDAIDALKGALDEEKTAELDLRQSKLNVQVAQKRLNDLAAQGKKGSFEYKQAQLDLEFAQNRLRGATTKYKETEQKTNLVRDDARHAASNAARAHREYKTDADKAGGAGKLFGQRVRDGILVIPKGRVIKITATFGFKTPPDVSMHDIVGATGGYVTPRAIVPRKLHRGGFLDGPGTETSDSIQARLSKGEYVVRAKAVKAVGRDTMDQINAQGFAAGGGVDLQASFPSTSPLQKVVSRFEGAIDRALGRLATKWDRYAEREFGGAGKPAVTRFIRSTDPLPYVWGGAGPGGYDCSGLVGAVHMAHLGRAYGHGQRLYTTSSIGVGSAGLKPGLGGVLSIGVTPGRGHMAGR